MAAAIRLNGARLDDSGIRGARDPGLTPGIKPVNRLESHFINAAANAVTFIRAMGRPNVKVHLDTFHIIREEDS